MLPLYLYHKLVKISDMHTVRVPPTSLYIHILHYQHYLTLPLRGVAAWASYYFVIISHSSVTKFSKTCIIHSSYFFKFGDSQNILGTTDRYKTCSDCTATIPLSCVKIVNLYILFPVVFMNFQISSIGCVKYVCFMDLQMNKIRCVTCFPKQVTYIVIIS